MLAMSLRTDPRFPGSGLYIGDTRIGLESINSFYARFFASDQSPVLGKWVIYWATLRRGHILLASINAWMLAMSLRTDPRFPGSGFYASYALS